MGDSVARMPSVCPLCLQALVSAMYAAVEPAAALHDALAEYPQLLLLAWGSMQMHVVDEIFGGKRSSTVRLLAAALEDTWWLQGSSLWPLSLPSTSVAA